MLLVNNTLIWVKILLSILVSFHIFCIWYFSINAGWWDDYIVAFYEIEGYLNAKTLNEKFKILVGPFGDHRSMLSRIFFLIQIRLNGNVVNYRYLMIIGNVFSLLIVWVFYKAWKIEKWNFLFFIPIVMFVLNLQFYEAQFFANGVFGYIAIVFFSTLIVWETAYKGRIWLLMILATIALLTFGNALFVLVAVLTQLIFQRRTKNAIIWLIYCTVVAIFYFTEIQNPHFSGNTQIENIDIIKSFKAMIYHLGSPLNFNSSLESKLCLILGSLQFVLLSYFMVTIGLKFVNKFPISTIDSFLLGLYIFGGLSVTAIAFLKHNIGMDIMFLSRYRLAPTLLLIISYIMLIRLQKKVVSIGLLIFSTCCYYIPTKLIFFNKTKNFHIQKQAENWILKNRKGTLAPFNDPFDFSRIKNVHFKPDDSIVAALRSIDFSKTKPITQCSELEIKQNPNGSSIIFHTTRKISKFSKNNGLLLFFKNLNAADDFLVTAQNDSHPKEFLKELIYNKHAFSANITKAFFQKGTYDIYILEIKNNTLNAFQTNQKLIL